MSDQSHYFGQFNYVGVGVTRGLHSSTPVIYTGSATYQKLGSFAYSVVVVKYDGGSEQYNLNLSDIFIDIGVGIGTVGIQSDTQIIINTQSTENPNVQVGDVVNFVGSNPSLGGAVLPSQRSRVVGVGTFYFIIEDNINSVNSGDGDASVTKLETFLPTGIGATGNYRGAICLNDSDDTVGDFDDFIVRCHSANISGSGSGSVVTSYNYENNGAFYGPPVTVDSEQHGGGGVLKGYIFNDDGLRGDDDDDAGGIDNSAIWKRVRNTFYRYSIPTVGMEYINGGDADNSGNTYPAGQLGRYFFSQDSGNNRIFINLVDANGNNNQDFFLNTIGKHDSEIYPDPTLWNFKVTSLETKSQVGIYSSERSYVWCRIITDDDNGDTFTPDGGTTRLFYSFEVIACNTNISSGGQPGNSSGFGGTAGGTKKSIIEWFKSENTTNGNMLTFHGSCDAGNNNAFLFAAQKVQDNNWTHITRQVARNDLDLVGNNANHRIGNKSFRMLPNLDYRVWNYSAGNNTTTRPYFKIINHPEFDTTDE